jgi:acyl transferase domain-containing protein
MLNGGKDQVRADEQRGDFEAGFLDSVVSRFDHHYFGISEAESKTMDPQQILALELTELLWSDAGIDPRMLDRSRVGVYIGAWNEEYRGNRNSVYYPTGTNPSIIASRISHHYDLRGPSWVVNSACSSSLVALHYACKDIEAGRIDYAIAGGVNMILGNEFSHSMRDSGFLSQDQRCKTFDDSANGYVRAEGGGLVLLVNKELAEAYYAEILGSSINQNGSRTQVITAPHPEAQEELIMDACRDANVSPADIGYVECHGTGTKLGDPIEISALQNTIARNRETPCYLGSVKSNMGHLESAAGVAGLLKAILVVNH